MPEDRRPIVNPAANRPVWRGEPLVGRRISCVFQRTLMHRGYFSESGNLHHRRGRTGLGRQRVRHSRQKKCSGMTEWITGLKVRRTGSEKSGKKILKKLEARFPAYV